MSGDYRDHRVSERMVHALANRVMRRLASIRQPILSREDVVSELWVAWCKARDRYEPERGIPWAAYLQRGMILHINREIEARLERNEGQTFAKSLDAAVGGDQHIGRTMLSEIIEDENAVDPLDVALAESNYQRAMTVLSPRAQTFLRLLREQPPQLLNEVLVAQDKAEHAAKIGAPFNAPRRITFAMIFDLMDASRGERSQIMKEVNRVGQRNSA